MDVLHAHEGDRLEPFDFLFTKRTLFFEVVDGFVESGMGGIPPFTQFFGVGGKLHPVNLTGFGLGFMRREQEKTEEAREPQNEFKVSRCFHAENRPPYWVVAITRKPERFPNDRSWRHEKLRARHGDGG